MRRHLLGSLPIPWRTAFTPRASWQAQMQIRQIRWNFGHGLQQQTPAGGRAGGGRNDEIGPANWLGGCIKRRGHSLRLNHFEVEPKQLRLQTGLALLQTWMAEQRIDQAPPRAAWVDQRHVAFRGLQRPGDPAGDSGVQRAAGFSAQASARAGPAPADAAQQAVACTEKKPKRPAKTAHSRSRLTRSTALIRRHFAE